ncbi:unnamed protein product [Strongylus vulgaris]|uniref:Uncharacterized protein n=1 Tax=Strongylus vulgaris TaxID=40348 RepID=A0A3P7LXE3_STRVU|nr:unnamed protein product [Strongylus vulgaris]
MLWLLGRDRPIGLPAVNKRGYAGLASIARKVDVSGMRQFNENKEFLEPNLKRKDPVISTS